MAVHASDGRPTVGVLMGWQYYWTATPLSYLEPLVRGMRRAAQDRGCHLLLGCGMGVSGSASDPLRPAWPLALPETDFVPIGAWNTDGLIAVTPLHVPALSRDIQRMIAAGHPVQFVGSGERGPTIAADNTGGVLAAMRHLVEHGHRRIAFIAGSPDDAHGDSGDRLRAYRTALNAHGLAADERLVGYGRHVYAGGRAAMREVLRSGAAFSAVLASNDESALGAAEALQEAGRRVPHDVALVGFDDRPESAVQRPGLSSVRVPLFQIGYRAVELLLARIAGEPGPAEIERVATSLVPRESCGCDPAAQRRIAPPDADLARAMAAAVRDRLADVADDAIDAACLRLLDAIGAPDSFDAALGAILADPANAEVDAHHWQAAIALVREASPGGVAREALDRAAVTLSRHMQWQHRSSVSAQRWDANRMHILTAQLQLALDEARVFEVLARHLPAMGIARGWVALFEPGAPADARARCTVRSLTDPAAPPAAMPLHDFPPASMAGGAPLSLAVLPLITPRGQLGVAAFDSRRLELYGAIVQQLAGALHTAQLYREATESRRLAEEASQLKSRFLSTVSHELRTPLNLIVGLSAMLTERSGAEALPAPVRRDLERISADAQHLGGLIGDVLDLASSDAGQLRLSPELVDLGAALRPVAQAGARLASDAGLAWRADLPDQGPWVWGDRTRLRQVALNLVSNAIKFTRAGEVALVVSRSAGVARISVCDTGLGVPPEDQGAVFDEFHRSARSVARGFRGLGLGLAICRRLVELHGGTIGVESAGREGAGSTFFVELPAAAPGDQAAAPVRLSDHTVLVVDDEPATLDLHARIVGRHWPAARVLRAANGREALAILGQARVDLVLLDLLMPELDGFGVLEAMREDAATRDTAVIVLTGQALSRQEIARLDHGVAAVMSKGVFSAAETLARLDAAMARRRGLSGETRRLVRQAMAYVHEHYARPITRQELARHVGLAEDYLTSCFHKEVGMAPITYLNRYRVRQAKILLRQSAAPIGQIAAAVGFTDSAYFSRIFRREAGVSPDAFRRAPAPDAEPAG